MGELLEFTGQIEFDFKMSSYAERGQKEELEGDCKQVVSHAKSSFKEMCLLSLKLSEIKQKGQWENVINPETGYTFLNNTFAEFTKYAFDLSKTKTSNLLRLSQFVCWYGEERGEIEPAYKSYGYSQLVELASVPPEHRAYFHSEMSVDEMQIAKDYVKNSGEFFEEKKKVGFDLLTKAQEWKENEQKQKQTPARSPDVMDGQLSFFSEEHEEENERGEASPNPTSDLTQVCEEEKENAIKGALTYVEGRAILIYKKYKENPLHSELVNFIKDTYRNGDYCSWLSCPCGSIKLSCTAIGLTITKYTSSFKEIFSQSLSWEQTTQRIVSLINNDEYLSHTVKFSIDEQLKKSQTNDQSEENAPMSEEIEREFIPERDEYDEADEVQEDMRADMQTIEEAAEESVSETPRVDLSKNLKIREFMHGFEKWGRMYCAYPLEFMKVYYHAFRNGKAILAVLSPCCSDMEKMERDHSTVRYYWKNGTNEEFLEVTTRELERVLPLINEEL